jgi:hypothetical protein
VRLLVYGVPGGTGSRFPERAAGGAPLQSGRPQAAPPGPPEARSAPGLRLSRPGAADSACARQSAVSQAPVVFLAADGRGYVVSGEAFRVGAAGFDAGSEAARRRFPSRALKQFGKFSRLRLGQTRPARPTLGRASRRCNSRSVTPRRPSRSTSTCTNGRTCWTAHGHWSTGRSGTRSGGHVGWKPSMTAARQVVPNLCPRSDRRVFPLVTGLGRVRRCSTSRTRGASAADALGRSRWRACSRSRSR